MILELKIKNFLSFKEEVTFSFEATKDKSFEDYQVVEVTPDTRILRLAVVYGANASGKSNLIKAFEFLRYFWFYQPENKDKATGAIPFLLDNKTPQAPSEFSLIFYIEGIKYLYFLELDTKTVLSEKLFVYPGTQPALIFDRKLNERVSEIMFNPKRVKLSQAAKEEITLKCLTNMSVLAAYNQVNILIPEMENVVKWLKSQYLMLNIESDRMVNVTENIISQNRFAKAFILNFLKRADYNITDISIESDETMVQEEGLSKTIKYLRTEFEHKVVTVENREEFYMLPKYSQSQGTLRTFGLAGAMWAASGSDAFLAIDEIESSLHPRLVEFIIEDFFKQKSQSQLLLTTHYDGLLEEDDLLRKDSIWFTDKKENGSTELYSLADFKGVNRISSLQKAYKYGKFGAIPNI